MHSFVTNKIGLIVVSNSIELFSKETGKKMSYAHICEEAATYDLNQVESL
ncbi:MAG: hypothetical protein WA220_13415 [Candidatus Nitrosopolaris sp.]